MLMQVEAVKGGLAPEVEKLALALQRKSGRVGELQDQLVSRLRWGVARLQASHAAGELRHVLAAWRWGHRTTTDWVLASLYCATGIVQRML